MIKALLPALAFFGSVAYATSPSTAVGKKGTKVSSKKGGFLEIGEGDTGFQRFVKGSGKHVYEGLFGKGGALTQASSTTIPNRINAPPVARITPVKPTPTQFYVPGLSNERLMSKAQIAAGNPMINAIFGKAMQYNPRVGRNINLKKPSDLKNIKSRISPKQVYA